MSEMIQHPITHKVLATDDKGEHHPQWFGSINGGESYIGLASEPEAGAYIELAKGFGVRESRCLSTGRAGSVS